MNKTSGRMPGGETLLVSGRSAFGRGTVEHKELRLLEIDYTQWGASCRDPYITSDGQLVQCRRQTGHDEDHATRAGAGLIEWGSASP